MALHCGNYKHGRQPLLPCELNSIVIIPYEWPMTALCIWNLMLTSFISDSVIFRRGIKMFIKDVFGVDVFTSVDNMFC